MGATENQIEIWAKASYDNKNMNKTQKSESVVNYFNENFLDYGVTIPFEVDCGSTHSYLVGIAKNVIGLDCIKKAFFAVANFVGESFLGFSEAKKIQNPDIKLCMKNFASKAADSIVAQFIGETSMEEIKNFILLNSPYIWRESILKQLFQRYIIIFPKTNDTSSQSIEILETDQIYQYIYSKCAGRLVNTGAGGFVNTDEIDELLNNYTILQKKTIL